MTTESFDLISPSRSHTVTIREHIDREIDELLASFPNPAQLSDLERRGIIARYTAVLEGNFIYWMTAAYLCVGSHEAHSIIQDNLLEEVRDNHPGMLRRFATAACAVPTDSDALAVARNLEAVRQFVARLSPMRILPMMAFFEGFITRFMPYLAELAKRRGSTEQEYTDVHGVCDVVHTEELFRALQAELATTPDSLPPAKSLLDGVDHLRALIRTIVV